MQVLGKMSDAVGKLGGAQVSYRLASVRQELQVDKEYAEFLQAEAEDLSLMTSGPKAPIRSQGVEHLEDAAEVMPALISTAGKASTRRIGALDARRGAHEKRLPTQKRRWIEAEGG